VAQRMGRGIALLFHDHGTRRGRVVSVTPRPYFTPGKDPVPNVQEAGWAPGPVWTGAENLAPTGIRSSDRSARSQSLYRLSYPAHKRKLSGLVKSPRSVHVCILYIHSDDGYCNITRNDGRTSNDDAAKLQTLKITN
jgi:hypothetical protein